MQASPIVKTLKVAALALGLTMPCWAEQIVVPVGSQQGAQVSLPQKGISMGQVQSRYGEPDRKSGPVGQPPISTWDYPTFTVYFEHEHTIHSVLKHVAQPIVPTPQAAQPIEEDSEE